MLLLGGAASSAASSSGGGRGSSAPALSAISIQTMGYGVPVQVAYGSTRVSPTLGYLADFTATAHESSSGGKGGGDGGGSISYTYAATIEFFVCEGVIRGYGKAWRDKDIYADTVAAGFNFLSLGTYPQSTWGVVDTYHPTESLAYSGTALLGASSYQLGSNAALGNHSVEVFGRCLSAISTDQNYLDAHVRDVVIDFLTEAHYGAIASQSAVDLETDRMHDYCRACGILISPLLRSQKPAHEYLSQWAMVANAGLVWSEGKLKFIPYADENITGNGVNFISDNAIRYAFDDDTMAELIKPRRKKPADAFNSVPFECLDRANDYNKFADAAKDQASIESVGIRPASSLMLDCICVPGTAVKVAHTQLLRGLYIRKEYTISGWCDADLLEPLDFISVTDVDLGENAVRCRVTAIEDGQEGVLTITAEEAPLGCFNG